VHRRQRRTARSAVRRRRDVRRSCATSATIGLAAAERLPQPGQNLLQLLARIVAGDHDQITPIKVPPAHCRRRRSRRRSGSTRRSLVLSGCRQNDGSLSLTRWGAPPRRASGGMNPPYTGARGHSICRPPLPGGATGAGPAGFTAGPGLPFGPPRVRERRGCALAESYGHTTRIPHCCYSCRDVLLRTRSGLPLIVVPEPHAPRGSGGRPIGRSALHRSYGTLEPPPAAAPPR